MASGPAYPYEPLDGSAHSIRLLSLLPAVHESDSQTLQPAQIRCTLAHVSLTSDSCPSYTALSYVWGSDDPSTFRTISLNNQEIPITYNLFEALSRLRQRFLAPPSPSTGSTSPTELTLWVDAICIDQSSDNEKSAQVQLMGSIYKRAQQVLVWLGEDDSGEGARGLHLLRDLGVFFREFRESQASQFGNDEIAAFVRTVLEFAAPDPADEESREPKFDFESLWKLFKQRPWWSRVWVIQEVVLATSAYVLCGAHAASWDDLREGMQVLEWMILFINTEPRYASVFRLLKDLYPDYTHFYLASHGYRRSLEQQPGDGGMSLLETIMWTSVGGHAIEATDPRDRIYGLLGMVCNADRESIPVAYSHDMTLSKILFTVGKTLVERHGPDIMAYCAETALSASLPSWVPDWTAQRGSPIGGVSFEEDNRNKFRASSNIPWQETSFGATYAYPSLSLRGWSLGKVAKIRGEYDMNEVSTANFSLIRTILQELREMVEDTGREMPEQRQLTARSLDNLWRVPIADCGLVGRAGNDPSLIRGYDVLRGVIKAPLGVDQSSWISSESWPYRRALQLHSRRTFVDRNGQPGIGPSTMLPDDGIFIFAGGHVPFIIRELSHGKFKLIGAAYLFGVMDGEAIREDRPDVDITLC